MLRTLSSIKQEEQDYQNEIKRLKNKIIELKTKPFDANRYRTQNQAINFFKYLIYRNCQLLKQLRKGVKNDTRN